MSVCLFCQSNTLVQTEISETIRLNASQFSMGFRGFQRVMHPVEVPLSKTLNIQKLLRLTLI